MEGSFKHDNETSSSIKCWEIPKQVRKWQLLRKGSQVGIEARNQGTAANFPREHNGTAGAGVAVVRTMSPSCKCNYMSETGFLLNGLDPVTAVCGSQQI